MAKSAKLIAFKLADASDVLHTIHCHLNGVTFPRSRDFEAFQTFCATEKSAGPLDARLELTGRWEGTPSASDVEEILDTLIEDDDPHAWEYYPQGEVTGKRYYSGVGLVTEFTVTQSVPGNIEVSATIEVDGAVTKSTVGS